MTPNQPFKLTYRAITIVVLIMLVAFALRTVLLFDRAAAGNRFIPEPGSDQARYYEYALGFLDGSWPNEAYWFHPLPSYVFAGLLALTNQSLVGMRLILVWLDALTCAAMAGAAWLMTRRLWGGWLAATIYAIYPVSIFYGTTLLIAPLATGLVAWIGFFTLWQGERLSWWRTVVLGLLSGALAAGRMNIAPIAAIWLIWLALSRPGWRRFLGHVLLWGVMTAAVIAPFTAWNYYITGGDFIPVAQTGPKEIYMANNRDAGGLYASDIALENVDTNFWNALWRDIEVAPVRFIGLLGRKFALFWGASEPGNNIDYTETAAISPLLQVLYPFNFVWLVIPGLLGLAMLWYRDKRWFVYFGLVILWMAFSGTVTYGYSRTRYPAVVPLMMLGIAFLVQLAVSWQHINWQHTAKRYALPVIITVGIVLFPLWALAGEAPPLPPKRTYSELPADAIAVNATFDGVTLVGWRPIEQWPAASQGWVAVTRAYTVELFWEVPAPTEEEYQFYLAYIDEGTRYAAVDRAIGSISYPPLYTSDWEPGTLHGEIVSVRVPRGVPLAHAGQMILGVYRFDRQGLIHNVPMSSPVEQANLLLQQIAVYDPKDIPAAPGLPTTEIDFGGQIALKGYALSEEAIELYWEAIQDVTQDVSLFVHIVNEAGDMIPMQDGPPIADLPTSNWMPGYPLEQTILLPQLAHGVYEVYIGLYRTEDGQRLAVDAPDYRLSLGTLAITAD
ncbi:hypothetical protein G4Y79_07400 [Phototrophicus methaneseepsis]|uniref:Glycosyltransferase RgtA/B/C/D-like domain-containing protein n=1 Tax=Phototrophicus methaneseepsis TaxID=2710758 RepID=A0A7S8EC38_9CHLR|nr:hypothetical protein [Phototrophicus methaneseepsis]QPC84189.1 hypothetical protein G4Y79_07400 [Phototrophicus methaneseepsis]